MKLILIYVGNLECVKHLLYYWHFLFIQATNLRSNHAFLSFFWKYFMIVFNLLFGEICSLFVWGYNLFTVCFIWIAVAFQNIIVYILNKATNFNIISIWIIFSMVLLVEYLQKVFVFLAGIVNNSLCFLIVYEDEHRYVTQNRQLHGLLENTFLSLAVCHFPLGVDWNPRYFINFLFSHAYHNSYLYNILIIFIYEYFSKLYILFENYIKLVGKI